MSFRKFQADGIFTGTQILDIESVLITSDRGIIQEIVSADEAGENIEKLSGLLSPGFINCHCHLELSHMKGLIPENTGLIDFVFKVVTQRHFPNEEILSAIEQAELEMINQGIVAVGDICNNTYTLHQKQKHNLSYYNFIEASGWLPDIANTRLTRSKEYYEAFIKFIATSTIVPHAPYSVSGNLWELITPYFRNKVVSIHNQETSFEDELFIQGSGDFVRMYEMMKIDNSFFKPVGKSSLQSYFKKLSGALSVILVHNTFIKEQDISYAKTIASANQQMLSFCLCANANIYIENHLPPVNLLRDRDSNIVLGTDSLASNWSLSILDEIKTIQERCEDVTLEEVLQWATSNGAQALQMQDKLGSFETGKQPGVVLIEGIEDGRITSASSARRLL